MSDPPRPPANTNSAPTQPAGPLPPARLARTAFAGVLMGIANLIPGVSGGTMILAMGIYQEFIDSVADITALRFSLRRIAFLGVLAVFTAGAIFGLAGVILYLLFRYPTAMYALFIGLTLGGAPTLMRLLRPLRADVVVATLGGLALMILVLLLRAGHGFPHNTIMDFVSGIVGATTMVLPGISGSYMLLVMDQYERVVGSIEDLVSGLRLLAATQPGATNPGALVLAAVKIIIPVGLGAALGIIGLSNLLKVLLHRWPRPTVGVLLGILLGSVIGLWPFGKAPGEKALERRSPTELRAFGEHWQVPGVAAASDAALPNVIHENWEHRGRAAYSADRIVLATLLVMLGFAVTFLLARGQRTDEPPPPCAAPRG